MNPSRARSVDFLSSSTKRRARTRAWNPHRTAPASIRAAASPTKRYWSVPSELPKILSQPSSMTLLVPLNIISNPIRRTGYMYQRRSEAERPCSPTAARSRAAIR